MVKKRERGAEEEAMLRNKGAWTAAEDKKLMDYVIAYGDKNWKVIPVKAGLNRCGKSCRLRWLNYLRPGIKRGNISEDEEDLIIRLHNLLGNRWSLIARRLPGRTDNEIKNHWNTHLSKRHLSMDDLNHKLSRKADASPARGCTPIASDYLDDWLLDFFDAMNRPAPAAETDHVNVDMLPADVVDIEQLLGLAARQEGGMISELGLEDHDVASSFSDGDGWRELLLDDEDVHGGGRRGGWQDHVVQVDSTFDGSLFDDLAGFVDIECNNFSPILPN